MGYWSVNCLNDFRNAELKEVVDLGYQALCSLLSSIGAEEAEHKVVPPCTRMEFLGNTVDSQKQTLEVSEHRKIDS